MISGLRLGALVALCLAALPAEAGPKLCGANSRLPKYDFAPLAQTFKSEQLTRAEDLARKLKQTNVCANTTTAQDQLCAIAVYLHEDETGPRALIGPVLALVINELPSSSHLPAYTFASAKQAITTDAQGFVRQMFFSEMIRTRLASEVSCEGSAPAGPPKRRAYNFITVIGWQENREKKLGIPAEYFNLHYWMTG